MLFPRIYTVGWKRITSQAYKNLRIYWHAVSKIETTYLHANGTAIRLLSAYQYPDVSYSCILNFQIFSLWTDSLSW